MRTRRPNLLKDRVKTYKRTNKSGERLYRPSPLTTTASKSHQPLHITGSDPIYINIYCRWMDKYPVPSHQYKTFFITGRKRSSIGRGLNPFKLETSPSKIIHCLESKAYLSFTILPIKMNELPRL
jgi:hypothetical protein